MEFAGIWRGGNDAYYLWTGAQWDDFQTKWNQLSGQGLRLVDLETYIDGNGVRRYEAFGGPVPAPTTCGSASTGTAFKPNGTSCPIKGCG